MSPLYVSDLDGTLLTNSATLSGYSRRGLQRLLAEGLRFTVASARNVVAMQSILRGLHIELPVIGFNGAFISDLRTGRHEVVNSMDSAVAEDLYQAVAGFVCKPLVSTYDGKEDRVYYCELANQGMGWYVQERMRQRDRRLRQVDNHRQALTEQVVCITSIGTAEQITELSVLIQEKHGTNVEIHLFENQYSPGWYWLTMHDKRCTKAQAVQALMQARGLGDSDLIAFGDHVNDLKLFHIATESVAVANAIPEARACATHVVESNEEDSVVRFIRRHWDRSRGKAVRSSVMAPR